RAWPSYSNSFGSAYELSRYTDPDIIDFPQTPAKDYKKQVPDTFYPALLVQFVEGFEQGPVCREEGYLLHRALVIVQDALADVIDEPKTKTKDALLAMLKDSSVTKALGYYRIFWHKSRLRFVSLFCDFCEKTLTKTEYTAKVYNEATHRGFGVSKDLRTRIRSLKGPSHSVTSLAIPLPLDPSTREGQLLITAAPDGAAAQILRHPVTNQVLLPDPSGLDDLPPASPLLEAMDDDDDELQGPASPLDVNDGPISPLLNFGDDDDGETEVSEDTEVKDVFKGPKGKGKAKELAELPVRRSPRIGRPKVSPSKVGPPVHKKPMTKSLKREHGTSLPPADEMREPSSKKLKAHTTMTVVAPPPQVAEPSLATKTKGSKSMVAEPHEPAEESEASLAHNDLDTTTHHALFLTNPNFQEHPDEKLSYDDTTLLATFFNWNSSCNLSAYLENPEEIEKFRQFLKDHKLESPSDPSTSGEAASTPVDSPAVEPTRTYSAMHASNWNAEAAAKPDEPTTPIPDEQKP
ncbi:hypothetical protein FB446DRAFT_709756, partial [Lentinula raphanica]